MSATPPAGCTDDGYGGCINDNYGCYPQYGYSPYRCIKDNNGVCQCLYDYYQDGCAIDRSDSNSSCVSYGGCESCGKYYDWYGKPYCWCQKYGGGLAN